MKQDINRMWLWAYLGPLFVFLSALISLYFHLDGALIPLAISVASFPATLLWRKWGILGASLLLGSFLLISSFPLYQTLLSLLVVGACFLLLLTLDRLMQPIKAAEEEKVRGWEKAKGLDAHIKEVQREHLKRFTAFKEGYNALCQEVKRERYLLNEARCDAYQKKLHIVRLEGKKRSTSSTFLMGQLNQLRSQFREKDRTLASTRRERYVFETNLLELEKRFNEERLNSHQESFWVAPLEIEEKEELEMLVGDLLKELKSRCVLSHSLDLSLLGKKL